MLGAARIARMKREMALFDDRPPHGISCWMKEEIVGHLEAQIVGGEDTPYNGGIFTLDIHLPDRYPFEPPKINFVTPIYHPNVDTGGRICLESLKMPPAGAWSPVLNVVTVLTTIQHLMAEPNPDDPLMADIAKEFKYNRAQYELTAQLWTRQHAMTDRCSSNLAEKGQGYAENIPKTDKEDEACVLEKKDVAGSKGMTDYNFDRNVLETDSSVRRGTSKNICLASGRSGAESDLVKREQLKENRPSTGSSSPPAKRKQPKT